MRLNTIPQEFCSPPMRCGKIICVGQNYREHIKELKGEEPEEPVIFLKPSSSLIADGEVIQIPAGIGRVDHEVELALVIGSKGKNIPASSALGYVMSVAVFNDVTARDVQSRYRKAGLALGLEQGHGLVRAHVPAAPIEPGGRHTPPGTGTEGQWRAEAEGQHGTDDIPSRGADRLHLPVYAAGARGHHRHRNAERGGSDPAGGRGRGSDIDRGHSPESGDGRDRASIGLFFVTSLSRRWTRRTYASAER